MHTQLKYEWRNSNPLVVDQIEKVKQASTRKRKYNDIPSGIDRQTSIKVERHQERINQINVIKTTMI